MTRSGMMLHLCAQSRALRPFSPKSFVCSIERVSTGILTLSSAAWSANAAPGPDNSFHRRIIGQSWIALDFADVPSWEKRLSARELAEHLFTGKNKKGSEREARCPCGVYPPQVFARIKPRYWLSGLKVRTPASVEEQTPAGSARTTPSSSAQKPLMPV